MKSSIEALKKRSHADGVKEWTGLAGHLTQLIDDGNYKDVIEACNLVKTDDTKAKDALSLIVSGCKDVIERKSKDRIIKTIHFT